MNYKVLYRKYRPESFDTLIGQDNVATILRDSIINDKISHAYIFSGPRGTGKTSTAKIFAKAINCLDSKDGNPCGKCENCLNFKLSSDIYEIDAASNTGVDQIREIIDNIKLTPISSRYKVYIIDEVHMLSTSAFNALLLTLEEPPGHVVFVLATTDIQEVPTTVLSRCQRLDFKRISTDQIEQHLLSVAKEENINISTDAAHEIADFSDGGMRDALSILDQLSKESDEITIDKVLNNIGLISSAQIEQLIDDINSNSVQNVETFIENVRAKAFDFKTIIKKLINELKKRAVKSLNNYSSDRLDFRDYKQLCFDLSDCLSKVNVNIDSYDLLEMALLDYVNQNVLTHVVCETKQDKIEDKIISREIILDKKEELVKDKNISREIFLDKNMPKVRINNCFCGAKKETLNIVNTSWKDFLDIGCSKKIKGLISDTKVVLASDEYFVIETEYDDSAININDEIVNIENEFNKYKELNYKIVAISKNNWLLEMDTFKKNKQNGIKYAYIPESENSNNSLVNIFQETNIEVK